MLSFDQSLLIQIVEALVLAILLNYLLLKPVMRNFEERRLRFQSLEAEISDYQKRAKELLEKYQVSLQEARLEGLRKQESLKEEARRLERERFQQINKEVETKKKEWEEAFQREIVKLREELFQKKELLAETIMEKLVGRRL